MDKMRMVKDSDNFMASVAKLATRLQRSYDKKCFRSDLLQPCTAFPTLQIGKQDIWTTVLGFIDFSKELLWVNRTFIPVKDKKSQLPSYSKKEEFCRILVKFYLKKTYIIQSLLSTGKKQLASRFNLTGTSMMYCP